MKTITRTIMVTALALSTLSCMAMPASAQDFDGNQIINIGDANLWNQWFRLCELVNWVICPEQMDLNDDGEVCTGDRDVIVDSLFTLYGDVNLDGIVNAADLNEVGSNWQQAGDWEDGDVNGDGIVNSGDLNLIGLNWQRTFLDRDLDAGRCTCVFCQHANDQ